jgi:hypothetical protein
MEPPAGAAPARVSLQRRPAGCCREAKNGRNPECCPRQSWLMKPARALARLRNGVTRRALPAHSRWIGFRDLGCSNNSMEFRCYAHFPGSKFWPSCNRVIPVLWNVAPLANALVTGKRIRGIFAKLFRRESLHKGGNGAPTRSCTGLACLPSRYIADNALGAFGNGRRETTCTSKAA